MIEWPCIDKFAKGKSRRFKLGVLCETVDPVCDRMLQSSYDLGQRAIKFLFMN